jgi:6-phosphogluconate dehydrogenase
VAVAGMFRDVEIDRRRWLCRAGVGFVGHGYSGGEGGKQDAAAVEHGFSP